MEDVDTVVLGLGAMGSAALDRLAQAGVEAVGVEQYRVGHALGSSHGQSRVFRLAYDQPLYTDLARAALPLWRDLEARSSQRLLIACGLLAYGRDGNERLEATAAALASAGVAFERLEPEAAMARWPAMQLPAGAHTLYSPEAGFTDAGGTVAAQMRCAGDAGARVLEETVVERVDVSSARPVVHTAATSLRCRRLVIAAGPWTAAVLPDLALPITVTRQEWHAYRPADPDGYGPDRLPVYADYDRLFYGFPAYGPGLKAADDNPGAATTADTVDRDGDDGSRDRLGAWLAELFPRAGATHAEKATCLYSLTPDRDFVIGAHPANPAVVVAAGFSGHGFKFTPLIGRILAELVREGATDQPIQRFSPERFR